MMVYCSWMLGNLGYLWIGLWKLVWNQVGAVWDLVI